MGEGSGILVLEERDRAVARGAGSWRRWSGSVSPATPDISPIPTRRAPGRPGQCGSRSSRRRPRPVAIGYVNAHATSTPAGDIAELRALAAAGLSGAPVSSTKSLHGHTLGAAGGIEAVAALMALVRDVLPGGANLEDPETDPPADLITAPRRADVDSVVSNSFGFGGHNAAVVFRRA